MFIEKVESILSASENLQENKYRWDKICLADNVVSKYGFSTNASNKCSGSFFKAAEFLEKTNFIVKQSKITFC
eukprot:snap_masked-scaffold_25-processed-gene-5.6-mRNA-1 protein AED:1.00 eAED:1.00 QI:0/0/0/0/1/1/2/0/72